MGENPVNVNEPLDYSTFFGNATGQNGEIFNRHYFVILTTTSLSQISHFVTSHMDCVTIFMIRVQKRCQLIVQNISDVLSQQTNAAVMSKHRVAY